MKYMMIFIDLDYL